MASDVSHSSSEKWMVTGDEEKGVWEEEKVESIWMASRRAILFSFLLFSFSCQRLSQSREEKKEGLPLREDMISRYMESDIIATDEHNFCGWITPDYIHYRGHFFSSLDKSLSLLLFGFFFYSPYVCLFWLIVGRLIAVDGVWRGSRGGVKMEVEMVGGSRTGSLPRLVGHVGRWHRGLEYHILSRPKGGKV